MASAGMDRITLSSLESDTAHQKPCYDVCPHAHQWEEFENHPSFHVPWHSTECGERWNAIRYRFVRAVEMTAQSLVPMGVVGISSLNEIRLRKMQKSSRMKVERQAKVGHVPAGTTFSPGAEPFDTQSTKLDQRGLGRGLLQFLATQGGTRPYQCPLSQNQLQITTSGWMGPISSLVGNGKTVSNSRGIQVCT